MTQECRPAKCIEAIRVAKLDQCTFAPVEGPLNAYAMGCIIDPAWSEEVEEGVADLGGPLDRVGDLGGLDRVEGLGRDDTSLARDVGERAEHALGRRVDGASLGAAA